MPTLFNMYGGKRTFSSCVSCETLSAAQILSFWELCFGGIVTGPENSVSGVEQTSPHSKEDVSRGDAFGSRSLSMAATVGMPLASCLFHSRLWSNQTVKLSNHVKVPLVYG